jgi:hypothetical protein
MTTSGDELRAAPTPREPAWPVSSAPMPRPRWSPRSRSAGWDYPKTADLWQFSSPRMMPAGSPATSSSRPADTAKRRDSVRVGGFIPGYRRKVSAHPGALVQLLAAFAIGTLSKPEYENPQVDHINSRRKKPVLRRRGTTTNGTASASAPGPSIVGPEFVGAVERQDLA